MLTATIEMSIYKRKKEINCLKNNCNRLKLFIPVKRNLRVCLLSNLRSVVALTLKWF